METERLKYRGRLEEAREKAARLKIKISGLRTSMREQLDPFANIDDLMLDIVTEQAIEARAAQIDYLAARDEINAIEKALGLN
jgi:phage-related minor tail protein